MFGWSTAVALLAAASGCNLLFDATGDRDAGVSRDGGDGDGRDGDPMPAGCPASGPPVFAGAAQVFSSERCTHYTQSLDAAFATAVCNTSGIVEAPLDSPQFVPMKVVAPSLSEVTNVRVSPEGTQLYVHTRSTAGLVPRIDVFRKSGGEWVTDIDTLFAAPIGGDIAVTAPSRGPAKRRILVTQGPPFVINEFVDSDATDTWTFERTYDAAYFGVASAAQLSMSADGLRLVFVGNVVQGDPQRVLYTSRVDTSLPFSPEAAVVDVGTGTPQFPYLRDDCTRIYVANVDTTTFKSQ
jgi:hypothetical protein